jgi:predicted transcriptional regulator
MSVTSRSRGGSSVSADRVKATKLVEALVSTGMPRGIALTLAFLSTKDEWATSKDIEEATRLRQPEVSIAVRELAEKGWVERDNLKRESKGRPINIYRMSTGLGMVFSHIEEGERGKIAMVEENLDTIRGLWSLS